MTPAEEGIAAARAEARAERAGTDSAIDVKVTLARAKRDRISDILVIVAKLRDAKAAIERAIDLAVRGELEDEFDIEKAENAIADVEEVASTMLESA